MFEPRAAPGCGTRNRVGVVSSWLDLALTLSAAQV